MLSLPFSSFGEAKAAFCADVSGEMTLSASVLSYKFVQFGLAPSIWVWYGLWPEVTYAPAETFGLVQ
jgi:hypothetical protein